MAGLPAGSPEGRAAVSGRVGSGRSRLAHLARRWGRALSRRPPAAVDLAAARQVLTAGEFELWSRMRLEDQRHSIDVWRRFVVLAPASSRAEQAGALLHDVGKLDSDLGIAARVVATIVGARGDRFRRYHRHEEIGASMLRDVGADPATIDLVAGRGPAATLLAAADDL